MTKVTAEDGAVLSVREIGQGPTVVLLHGFGMDSRHWLPIILPLAHRFRFVLPDLRGFGRSSHLICPDDCVLTSHARDLHEIIRELGNGDMVRLGGISLGASTALRYMELFGTEAIDHYLHIDQSPKISHGPDWPWGIFGEDGPEITGGWSETLSRLSEQDPQTPFADLPKDVQSRFYDDLSVFFQKAFRHRWMKWGAGRLARIPAVVHQLVPVENWPVLYQHMRAYAERDYDFRHLLPGLNVPSTLIAGRHSDMYPWEGQARMAELLPDARLVTMERSGHVPLVDQPLAVIREMKRAFS